MKHEYSCPRIAGAAIVSLALVFTPIMAVHGEDVIVMKQVTIAQQTADEHADIAQAEKQAQDQIAQVEREHPGCDIQVIATVKTHVGKISQADINAAVAAAMAEQGLTLVDPNPNIALVECAVAAVVIVVGTIMIIKLIHLCQKVLPPTPPPNPTNNASDNAVMLKPSGSGTGTSGASGDTNVYAAYIILGQDTSMSTRSATGSAVDVPFCLDTACTTMTLGIPTLHSADQLVSMADFGAQLESYGLNTNLSMNPKLPASSFSSNGIPVPSLDCIQYVNGMLTVKVPGTTSTVTTTNVLQRSTDMVNWTSLFTNIIVGPGQGTMTDGNPPDGNGFYRVVTQH